MKSSQEISISLLRQELTNLRIPYNQSSFNLIPIISYYHPPRNHVMWNVFTNLTASQLYIIDNLLS